MPERFEFGVWLVVGVDGDNADEAMDALSRRFRAEPGVTECVIHSDPDVARLVEEN